MHETKEILDVVFPSSDQAAEVVHSGKVPLYLPTSTVTTQLASVLTFASASPIGCNQFDAVVFREFGVEPIRVVGFVTDEGSRDFGEEASGKNLFHKLALGWRSALHRGRLLSASTAMIIVPLPRRVGPDAEAPFLALAKVASTNASSRFSWPRLCRWCARSVKPFRAFRSGPTVGTCGGMSGTGIFLRQFPPLRPRAQTQTRH